MPTNYAWDFENRLTSVTIPGGGVISFEYDPFGRRIYKSSTAGTTVYVYDGNNIIEEMNGTGSLQERYTYGPGTDEPLVGQRQPKIFFYEADGLGSVTSLTDPAGAVAATYTYDSFGFMTNSTGNATNWFRYTARQFDSDTALYYYRARYYDPTIGRFISEDPARFSGGQNFYTYVENNPMVFTDPLGLCKSEKQKCIDNFLKTGYGPLGNFLANTAVPDFSLLNISSASYWKTAAISAGIKGAFYYLPKLAGGILTTTGQNLTAYPGMAAAAADALEAGAFWTTTSATAGTVLAVSVTALGAFSTAADVYARYVCRDVQ